MHKFCFSKSITVALLILGSILGAGFASGRELISFFGLGISPIVIAIIVAALIFGVSSVFLFIGSRLNAKKISDVNRALVGRFRLATDAVLLVNSFIVLAAMLGAANSLGYSITGLNLPIYAAVLVLLSSLLALKGAKGLATANKIVVPIMTILLLIIAIRTVMLAVGTDNNYTVNAGSVWQAIVFVCMNMLLASTVITTQGRLNKKTIVASSAIAAIVLGALVFILLSALNANSDITSDMPVLTMARHIHVAVYWLMVIMLAAGIFTTMLTALVGLVSWFTPIFGGKRFSAAVVSVLGLVLANLGFATVVRVMYPIIGILGVIYVAIALLFVFRITIMAKRKKRGIECRVLMR